MIVATATEELASIPDATQGLIACNEGFGGIAQNRDAADLRRDFFQELEPIPSTGVFERKKPGGVPAWPRERGPGRADRIDDPDEHDRHAAARLSQGDHSRGIEARMTSGAADQFAAYD